MRNFGEFEVDGKRYLQNQYQVERGLELYARVAKVAAEPLAQLASVMDKAKKEDRLDDPLNQSDLVQIARTIATVLEPKEFVSLCKDLLEGCEVIDAQQKKTLSFNTDFIGNYGHLFKVLAEVLKFQFGKSFSELGAVIPAAVPSVTSRIRAK